VRPETSRRYAVSHSFHAETRRIVSGRYLRLVTEVDVVPKVTEGKKVDAKISMAGRDSER
jgi:hypothetical protein